MDDRAVDASDDGAITAWSAILSIALSVSCIITSELLPASLLTPMAADLDISKGLAGQAVTMTAFVALVASLFVTTATRGIDRRAVVLAISALATAANLLVAIGVGLPLLFLGRAILGVAVGAFWAISTALVMRMSRPSDIPKALSVMFGGVSVAVVIAAPLGSFLGERLGWRGVFFLAAGISFICLIWQARVIPSLPAQGRGRIDAIFAILRRPAVAGAMAALFAAFAGQTTFFTYIRPVLENVSGFGVDSLTFVFLVFGAANFLGTSLSSIAIRSDLKRTLAFAPLLIALCALGVLLVGRNQAAAAALIAGAGFLFGSIPVAWATWITRNLGDDTESAGSLQVAGIQISNALGAGVGGYFLDAFGAAGPVAVSVLLFSSAFAMVMIVVPARSQPQRAVPQETAP